MTLKTERYNKEIFICYRSTNLEYAKRIKNVIDKKSENENIGLTVYLSSVETVGNYLDDIEKIKEPNDVVLTKSRLESSDHVIFVFDNYFTEGFDREDCVTALEIKKIVERLKDRLDSIMLYSINLGSTNKERNLNFDDMRDYLRKLKCSEAIIKKFSGIYQNHIVIDEDLELKTKELLDGLLSNLSIEINSKNYLDLYKNYISYRTLPFEKIQRCIFPKKDDLLMKLDDVDDARKMVSDFYKLYIEKKVYKYSENDTAERIHNFSLDILNHNSVLIGNAGCGKSTLLYDIYFKYINMLNNVEENIETNKIIPIFVDLNTVKSNKLYDHDGLIGRIESSATIISYQKPDLVKIFSDLKERKYRVLLILDSLDECHVDLNDHIKNFESIDTFLKRSGITYNILLGLRTGLFEDLDISSDRIRRYMVKDFDDSDVKIYISNLLENGIITNNQLESIDGAIDLLTIDEKINPFLLSMIIEPYAWKPEYNKPVNEIKMVDLINDSAESQINTINRISRTEYRVGAKTLSIIGIQGLTGKNSKSANEIYVMFGKRIITSEEFDKDLLTIQKNTYLINKTGFFYQKIFTDYYAAKYVYLYLSLYDKDNSCKDTFIDEFLKIIESGNKLEFFGFLALFIDKNDLNFGFNKQVLNKLFDFMEKHCNYKAMYHNVCSMLEYLKRYSSNMNKKDSYALELHATYNADQLISYIYEKYFNYLSNMNKVDYGALYGSLLITNRFDLIISSVYNLIKKDVLKENGFAILSIIRDCFLNLNYRGDNKIYLCPYPFEFEGKNMLDIYKCATNEKPISQMNEREVLNALFYANSYISTDERGPYPFTLDMFNSTIFDKNYFPSIFNCSLFINNAPTVNSPLKLVDDGDNLIFDFNNENFSIGLIKTTDLNIKYENKDVYKLDQYVKTVFIYDDGVHFINNVFDKKKQLNCIELSNGIEIINKYTFSYCTNLLNVVIPSSLKRIEKFAFEHCDNLENLVLNDGIEFLGESIIEDCANIRSLNLPKSVKEIGNYAFEQCSYLENINFNYNNIKITDGLFKGCRSIVDIESLHLSKDIKEIPMIAFSSMQQIKVIDFRKYDKLEKIGNYCFVDNILMEKIYFPKSLKSIGNCCFYGCVNLKEIHFNSKPLCSIQLFTGLINGQKIDVFFDNHKYTIDKETNIIELFNKIGIKWTDDKFYNNIAFEKLDGDYYKLGFSFNEETIKYKDNIKFSSFDAREYAKNGIKIKEVCIGGLGNHDLLNDVVFDENLESTVEWMFEDCNSLSFVNLAKTKVKTLEAHMFKNCETLSEVAVPKTVTEIKEFAFDGCLSLKKVIFTRNCIDNCKVDKMLLSDDCFINNYIICDQHKENELIIPCNIVSIGDYAFKDCYQIKKVSYHKRTTTISPLAFPHLSDEDIINLDDKIKIQLDI